MKRSNQTLRKISFFCSLLALFSACSTSTSLQVLQPAMMKIPDHITTIAVVDRSKPAKGWLTALEGLGTGEGIGQDKEGRKRAVQGLTEALSKTPRFTVKGTGVELIGSSTGNSMLPPLDWKDIENYCIQYGADAIAVIEMFDSDQSVNTNRREYKEKNKEKVEVTRVSYSAARRLDVKIGWRLYDPKTKIILDEVVTRRGKDNTGTGDTEQKAKNNLPSVSRIVEDISFDAGLDYGARIAPTWITLRRNYFSSAKGAYNEDMKKAVRYVESSDWIKAAEIWQAIGSQKNDIKAAGRAVFNIAVANECLGKLDSALEFANKAYTEYGVSEAKTYIETLKMRQNDERKLEQQLVKPNKV